MSNPVRGIAETTGFATTPPPPADFVRATRASETTYLPVGVTPPARTIAPKTPEQIKAIENELDSTLNSHSSISGKPRPKQTYSSVARPPDEPTGDASRGGRFLVTPRETSPTGAKPQPR